MIVSKTVENILKAKRLRKLDNVYITLVLWHGNGFDTGAVYNEILVYSEAKDGRANWDAIYTEYYGSEDLDDTNKNMTKLLKEQATMYTKLSKVFDNVEKVETVV